MIQVETEKSELLEAHVLSRRQTEPSLGDKSDRESGWWVRVRRRPCWAEGAMVQPAQAHELIFSGHAASQVSPVLFLSGSGEWQGGCLTR